MVHGGADRGVRYLGERPRDPHHLPQSADVGECDQEGGLCLHLAENPHGLGLGLELGLGLGDAVAQVARGLRQAGGEPRVRIRFQQGDEPAGIGPGEIPQVRRRSRDRLDQGRGALMRCHDRAQRPAGIGTRNLVEPRGDADAARGLDERARRRARGETAGAPGGHLTPPAGSARAAARSSQ